MKINYVREEVARQLPRWQQIRDCLAGQDAIKAATTRYLPKPNAADTSKENTARYEAYVQRALFLNATANTCEGLVGQVFSADPVVEIPAEMAVLEVDADGAGVTLVQVARSVVREVMAMGRSGILTDFPAAPKDEEGNPRAFTREELQNGTAHPVLLQFQPEAIINWRTELRHGKAVLSLVVLGETYIAEDDGFEIKEDKQWRVLRLRGDVYSQEIWRENQDSATRESAPFVLHATVTPTDHSGRALDFIPFNFVGALNNNSFPDKPPMYDLSNVNIAHYRNSADYEDAVYMTGQPTPVITGLSQSWVKEVFKDQPILLGSRAAVSLPQGADMKLVAAEGNGLVKEAMESKEKQMVALGAQLVEQKAVQRTLGEAEMEKATTTSVLVQCAKNSAAAIQSNLQWASLFYGPLNEAILFTLSTAFAIDAMSPAERDQLLKDWQAGAISFSEMRSLLRQSGIATLDDEAAKQEIEVEMQARIDLESEAAPAPAPKAEGAE